MAHPRNQTSKKRTHSTTILTARSLDLLWSTLRTLFARDLLSLSSSCSRLGLLSLLRACSSSSLLLSFLDSSKSGGWSGLWSLSSSLLNHIEGSTNNGTLRLDCSAGSLLRNFLRDTLLVLSSEKDGPGNATGVLALEKERLGFAVLESEDLAITTNVKLALIILSAFLLKHKPYAQFPLRPAKFNLRCHARIANYREFVPFQGRSSLRRRCRRKYAYWRFVSTVCFVDSNTTQVVSGRSWMSLISSFLNTKIICGKLAYPKLL